MRTETSTTNTETKVIGGGWASKPCEPETEKKAEKPKEDKALKPKEDK